MKFKIIVMVIIPSLLCTGANFYQKADTVIAPFGLSSGQPPRTSTVQIIDAQIGFKAAQVCGYTDWTTAQVHLPMQLLSKKYWEDVGQKLGQKAREVVYQISGALPSMIACNISPQFCSVYNQAEFMAGLESQFTFDSCKVLDGVANVSSLQHEKLRECVAKETNGNTYTSPGQALSACLSGHVPQSKEDKINQTNTNSVSDDLSFKMEELIDNVFPGEVTTRSGRTDLNSGGRKYSRFYKAKSFMKELFPGISVSGSAIVERGGTFQPTAEKLQRKESQDLQEEVKSILTHMVELQQSGYADRQIIEKSSHLWKKNESWSEEGNIPHIYRPAQDDEEPTFLVSPQQILMLLPLANNENKENGYMSEELDQVIAQLSNNASYIKVTDQLRDIFNNAQKECKQNPKYHTAMGTQNCDIIIDRTKSAIEMLMLKQESEERSFLLQQRVAQRVRQRQYEKMSRYAPDFGDKLNKSSSSSKILIPGKS